jgi:hypothetical protein
MSYETGEILGETITPLFRIQQSAIDPTTTDIPSGQAILWWNTNTNTIKLWANKSGSLVSVALS